MKIRLQQYLINFFFYILTGIIIVLRHVDVTIEQTTSLLPFIIVGFIALVIYTIWSKKKTKIMRIKETKEIEDDKRKVGTIIYFYKKFIMIYLGIFFGLYYIQFNFRSLTGTMELVAVSLSIGAILRINLASNTGK